MLINLKVFKSPYRVFIMKVLIIIVGRRMEDKCRNNMVRLKEHTKDLLNNAVCDFACISSENDGDKYEDILGNIKYKVINSKPQLSKVCDFLSELEEEYDWYIKIRSEVELLEDITIQKLESLKKDGVNARVRYYIGPKKIKYGCSLIGDEYFMYCPAELSIILDDQIYIFSNDIVKKGGFNKISEGEMRANLNRDGLHFGEVEWFHTDIWRSRNISLYPCSLNVVFYHPAGNIHYSGHVNIDE